MAAHVASRFCRLFAPVPYHLTNHCNCLSMKFARFSLLFVLAFFVFSSLFAQGIEYTYLKENSGRQHKGFFLSMALGGNYSNIDIVTESSGISTELSGLGSVFDFKIGGALSENVILHGTLLSNDLTGPTIKSNLRGSKDYKADNTVYLSQFMLGIGLTYYDAENTFFSGSVGIGEFTLVNESEDVDVSSDGGIGVQIKAGKEWWVSRRWGLGAALYYNFVHDLNGQGTDIEEVIKGHCFGVMFNATLNGRR